ncbi:glycosyltransferase family 2 protein [Myxosarcina sp. GI1(2024)]
MLIWDDGSTDNSVEIARRYELQDRRIKTVAYHHQGFTKSLAAALVATKGKYLGWVDSDDLLHLEALAATVALLDTYPEVAQRLSFFR